MVRGHCHSVWFVQTTEVGQTRVVCPVQEKSVASANASLCMNWLPINSNVHRIRLSTYSRHPHSTFKYG